MGRLNIAVLISGSGTNLQALIDSVNRGKVNGSIRLVISNNKEAFGLKRAEKNSIKNLYIDPQKYTMEEYDLEIIKECKAEEIDLIVLAGYLKILSKEILLKYKNKIINIHPSLIPSFAGKNYYGIKVHKKAVEYGVKVSGATTHFVDEEPDGGPIIIQETVDVNFEDTAELLQKKVLEVEHKILSETVSLYCDGKLEVIGRKVKINK
ncbi:MAG: phosphoribosylglycinamide formyltransferase [Tissierellales bacterium]|nr:phosphoribosylglycinamide formyltransferase [Tissierellales bacterium]